MAIKNKVEICFQSLSENVAIASVTAAAFAAQIDITLNEIRSLNNSDIYNEVVLATIDCENLEELRERMVNKFK